MVDLPQISDAHSSNDELQLHDNRSRTACTLPILGGEPCYKDVYLTQHDFELAKHAAAGPKS